MSVLMSLSLGFLLKLHCKARCSLNVDQCFLTVGKSWRETKWRRCFGVWLALCGLRCTHCSRLEGLALVRGIPAAWVCRFQSPMCCRSRSLDARHKYPGVAASSLVPDAKLPLNPIWDVDLWHLWTKSSQGQLQTRIFCQSPILF